MREAGAPPPTVHGGESEGRRRWSRLTGAGCVLGALILLGPGTALADWGPPEVVGTDINQIQLAPGGQGFVLGFPTGAPARLRFALRPLDGTLGTPKEFPAGLGVNSLPVFGFNASGDGVGVEQEDRQVFGYSASTGGVSAAPQQLGLGFYPKLVSVAPSGAAIIGLNDNGPFRPVRLAFRPPGLNAQVDTVNTVDLSTSGGLVGLQLQNDGGAIAVWQSGDALYQAVRPSGSPAFNAPETIPSPGSGLSVAGFSSDPTGWAMLAWTAASAANGPKDEAIAAVRAPDGSFPAGTVVGTGSSIANATPAVTAAGDGLVGWWQTGLGSASCPATAIRGAMQHHGTWSPAQDLGPSAWPDTTTMAYAGQAFSAGDDVSVPMVKIHRDGAPCPTSPQTRSLIVHHFRSGPSGLTDQGTSELSPPSASLSAGVNGWAMAPGGRILAWYSDGTTRFLRAFDGVMPGGVAGGGPPAPAVPVPAATTPAAIRPLVLQQFVTIRPIDPRAAALEMQCPPDLNETCNARAWAYYLFTGKQAFGRGGGRTAAAKPRPTAIATDRKSVV
jgi:hypothetical protein